MNEPRKIVFVLEEFTSRSPGQQLLDRFLIGYNRHGEFRRPANSEVILASPDERIVAAVQSRVKDFGLKIENSPSHAVANSQAVVIVSHKAATPNTALHETVLHAMPRGSCCFIHGALASDSSTAGKLTALAASRSVSLSSGTSTTTAFQLPEMSLPRNARLRRALVVVQGSRPEAELEGLEGLFPFLQRRRDRETGICRAELIHGEKLWAAAYSGEWAPLLSSAVSRSNTIQGDPELDGRTQDVYGLRFLERLSKHPRAWILEHRDGVRTAIFVLDGALADINCAFQLHDATILSTQLYRPPPPMQDHFSQLASTIDEFFQTGKHPWQADKPQLIASALEQFALAHD